MQYLGPSPGPDQTWTGPWTVYGGPYHINIISISVTIDLKRSVGIRDWWIWKVPMSLKFMTGLSPTKGVTSKYMNLEMLTPMLCSMLTR